MGATDQRSLREVQPPAADVATDLQVGAWQRPRTSSVHRLGNLHLLAQSGDLLAKPHRARLGDVARLTIGMFQRRGVAGVAHLDLRQPGYYLGAVEDLSAVVGALNLLPSITATALPNMCSR